MTVASGFEPLEELLRGFAEATPGYTAQLAILQGGQPLIDISVGDISTTDLSGVYSCTKAAAAAVIGLLVQRGQLVLDAPVATYWPEFAAAGKGEITVDELLTHRAGLLGIDGGVSMYEYLDSQAIAQRLAQLPTMWRGTSMFTYHTITMGVFAEELVRRVTGSTLQQVFEDEFRSPHGIDFYLGLPEALEDRYVRVRKPLEAWPESFVDPFGIQGIGLNSTTGFIDEAGQQSFDFFEVPNLRVVRASGLAALGGVASARGLAEFFAVLPTVIQPATLHEMTTLKVFGTDVATGLPGAFGTIFQKPRQDFDFGSWRAYGHAGFNGALSYADPMYGLSVGYLPLHAELTGTGSRSDQISKLVRQLILKNG